MKKKQKMVMSTVPGRPIIIDSAKAEALINSRNTTEEIADIESKAAIFNENNLVKEEPVLKNKLIRCSRIAVDCVPNDPVDIRCGGPEYLGFDFNVKEEETEKMKNS